MMVRTVAVLAVFVCASCVLGAVTENEEPAFGSLYYDESSPNSNPPSLSLNLAIGGENLDLKLDQAPDLDLDFPVYVIDSNAEQFTLNRTATKSKLSMYQDKERGAAFMLVTNTDDSGNSTHVLEGLINKKGEAFHLHTQVPSSSFTNASGPSNNEINPSLKLQFKKKKIKFTGVYDSGVPGVERPTAAGNRTKTEKTTWETDPRHKRDVTGDVYVDIVAVVDYKAYSIWVARSTEKDDLTRQHDALEKARQYYAFVFNSMNMIYNTVTTLRFTINVRLVGLIIATDSNTLPTDQHYRWYRTMDSNDALDYFKGWVTEKLARLPNHDHLIMFTGYDLSSHVAGSDAAGLGYIGTVCQKDGRETCIVEETGTFESVFYAAHELGHGLSARHDGEAGNYCSGTSHYLMEAGFVGVISEWTFSPCTADYFSRFISSMAPFLRESCMFSKITASSDIPDVTSLMPGQVYNVTQQCQAFYGPDSYFSQAILLYRRNSYIYLCGYMSCWNRDNSLYHYELAAQGTTCGDKMWCINGYCVHDSAAPSAQSDCLFGDQPGGVQYTTETYTCAEVAATRNYECYEDNGRHSCCATCAKLKRHVRGCEYGDSYTRCNVARCPYYSTSEQQRCCQTCNYGTPYTPQPAIDGQWGSWGSWSSCGVTCGNGTQRRTRYCNNPAPQNGGYYCRSGSNTEAKVCSRSPCVVDGQWGWWASWSNCSVTCGGSGTRTRTHYCDNPTPQNGGHDCRGSSEDVINCYNYNRCPRGKASSLGGERTLIVVAIVAVWFLHRDYLPFASM